MLVETVTLSMSVIAEFTASGSEFAVGRALAVSRGATVDLEPVVPLDDGLFPYVRVRGEIDPAVFEEALAATSVVDTVEDATDDDHQGHLYHVTWTEDAADGVVALLLEHSGQVLAASARDGTWTFRLRFATSAALADFQRAATTASVDLDVGRVYAPTDDDGDPDYGLTPAQVDALVTAVETGYFRVPRGISTADLGAILGISDQAVSERIRRGVETLTRNALNVPNHRRKR
jgi:hypothetical protein